jgi:hypothetical protein
MDRSGAEDRLLNYYFVIGVLLMALEKELETNVNSQR